MEEVVNIEKAYSSFHMGLPCATIQIGSEKPWQEKEDLSIQSIEISSTVEKISSNCRIVLNRPQIDYTDSGVLQDGPELNVIKQGEAISVRLGYSVRETETNKFYDAFKGFISSVQVSYGNDGATVVLDCMDAKMWMMAGCKTEEKKGNKYSTIVRSVLQQASYTKTQKILKSTVSIGQEPNLNQSIYQINESDYSFLCRLSKITGCLFFVYLGEVYFIDMDKYKSDIKLCLSPCGFMENIKWKSNVLGLSNKVTVNGIDPLNPSKEVQAKIVKKLTNIGISGSEPTKVSKNIDEATAKSIKDESVDTVSYAKFIAQSHFTRDSIKFISCVVNIPGLPLESIGLKLGMGVQILGYGKSINNNYILMGVKQKFAKHGKLGYYEFKTDLTLATDTC